MRSKLDARLDEHRVRHGPYKSQDGDPWGQFLLQGPCGEVLAIMSSGGQDGWEHVSVSTRRRIPNWQEMAWVKDLFWNDDECVMQLHVPKADHINIHPNVLHLWRPLNGKIPMPPKIMV